MRILTLIDAFKLGGAETLVASLARVGAQAGIDLDVLSLHPSTPERSTLEPLLREAGLQPRYLNVRRTTDLAGMGSLVKAIKASGADVVHAHLEMAITLGVPAAALAGVPAVCTFHHVHRPLAGRAGGRERLAVSMASRSKQTIFVSEASRRSFVAKYRRNGVTPANWTVLHNGIDLDQFAPPAVGTTAELPADLRGSGPVVTVLAALRDFKGIENAVRAWPAVLAEHPDARLLLVGSGDQEAILRAYVQNLDLTGSVVFTGMRSDVTEILRGSDIVALPSTHGENLPTVLMEAGACGRPVVASRIGGIPDIVDDGRTGLLVPAGNPTELAVSLNSLLDDPARRARMGAAARIRIEERFDNHLWAANLAELYRRAGHLSTEAVSA